MLDPQSSFSGREAAQLPKLGQPHIKGPVDPAKAEAERTAKMANEYLPKDHVVVTSIAINAQEVAAPQELNLFGQKIDLKTKVGGFKDNYSKNYALSKSHNLMVARFAEVKTAFYGYLLSLLGVSPSELKGMRQQAIDSSIKQNQQLFAENEYNSELLAIVGGGSKKTSRAQQKIVGEVRSQLITQAKNLGIGDQYNPRQVLALQLEQCKNIAQKFQEEKSGLEYQLQYRGVS